jgi:hypothetical protein
VAGVVAHRAPAAVHESDDGRGLLGRGGDPMQGSDVLGDERLAQHQVLGRVPGDRQLG